VPVSRNFTGGISGIFFLSRDFGGEIWRVTSQAQPGGNKLLWLGRDAPCIKNEAVLAVLLQCHSLKEYK